MAGEAQWRGVVNGVLYVVQFEPTLDDEAVVTARAEQLRAVPLFGQPIGWTVQALRAALADGRPLAGGIPQPHDEGAVREYLGRLADRLDPPPRPAET